MIVEILTAIFAFGLTALLAYVFQVVSNMKFSVAQFKKKSRGLPIVKNMSIFNGHLNGVYLHKRNWKILYDLRRLYGDTYCIFHCKQPIVSTVDLDLLKTMVLDNDECNRVQQFGSPVLELEIDTIMLAVDDHWRRIRKAVASAFATARIKTPSVQADLSEVVESFIGSIEDKINTEEEREGKASVVMDMEDHSHRFTLAYIFTSFYKQDKVVDFHAKKDQWQQVVDKGMRSLTNLPVKISMTLPVFRPLIRSLVRFSALGKIRADLSGYIRSQTRMNLEARQQIAETLKNSNGTETEEDKMTLQDGGEFKRGFIDDMIDAFHDGKLTEREYLHSSFFLFIAAYKATSDILSKLLYILAVHSEVQDKLRQSILVDGTESEYLTWCLNETMRLYPPILSGCARRVKKPIETKEGYTVPEDSFVIPQVHTIHRLPQYWGPDAEEFKPQRWADTRHFHPMQFMPFGAGKRGCPGKDLAIASIRELTCAMIRKYKLNYIPGSNDKMLFEAPLLIVINYDGPTNIEVSRL